MQPCLPKELVEIYSTPTPKGWRKPKSRGICLVDREGQAWCSGESCLTESPGHGFKAASPQILRGEACLGFSLPRTPLMWESPALGMPFFICLVDR
jgi:hypothetical protein